MRLTPLLGPREGLVILIPMALGVGVGLPCATGLSAPRRASPRTWVFSQGFTTKKRGHGFGLHISALAAAELKGRLSVESAGPGRGAPFTIELPFHGGEGSPAMAPAS